MRRYLADTMAMVLVRLAVLPVMLPTGRPYAAYRGLVPGAASRSNCEENDEGDGRVLGKRCEEPAYFPFC